MDKNNINKEKMESSKNIDHMERNVEVNENKDEIYEKIEVDEDKKEIQSYIKSNEDEKEIQSHIKSNEDNIQIKMEKSEKTAETQNNKKSTSKFRKILDVISKAILFVLIAIMIVIIIRALAFKKTDIFGYKFYVIKSGSMEPTIQIQDAVITKETDDIKEGDIIAFNNSNSIVVHRVVGVDTQNDKTIYTTKGDNNNAIDEDNIGISNIEGRVVMTVPKIGKAIMFLRSHFIILIYIIAIIIIITLIRRLI